MPIPLQFTAGTTTANSVRSMKLTKLVFTQTTATQAASALISDINGNVLIPQINIATSLAANQQIVLDYAIPVILPGGEVAPASGSAIPNFIVTVVGAGATLYLHKR
jgi:hypothetical protein